MTDKFIDESMIDDSYDDSEIHFNTDDLVGNKEKTYGNNDMDEFYDHKETTEFEEANDLKSQTMDDFMADLSEEELAEAEEILNAEEGTKNLGKEEDSEVTEDEEDEDLDSDEDEEDEEDEDLDSEEDEEDEEDDSDSDEDDEDDLDSIEGIKQKGVQKRISKLVAKRKAVEQQNAEYERRIKELEVNQKKMFIENGKQQISAFENMMAQKNAEFIEASEEMDWVKASQLQQELNQMQYSLMQSKDQIAAAENEVRSISQVNRSQPKKAVDWVNTKGSFLGKPGFEAQTQFAHQIDAMLTQQGLDVNSDEYYNKLNKYLNIEFPGLIKEDKPVNPKNKKKKVVSKKRTKSPVSNGAPESKSTKTASRDNNKGRIVFTDEDAAMVSEFGLNPNDPKVRMEFLKQKKADILRSRKRR